MPSRLIERARRLAGLFVVLLSGCTSLPPLPSSLPASVELTDTPFFPQETHQCGPAALATLLNYRGIEVSPQQLTPQVYLPQREGSLQVELTAGARRYAQLAYPLAPRLEDLLTEVAAGNPVLVLQNLAFGWLPLWHYAVVIGYDLPRNEVILRSGTHERRISKLSAFQNTWGRAERWALVILPAGQIPATATPQPYLKASYELEQTDMPEAAQQAYAAAARHWPQDKTVWLALANNAYGLKRYPQARAALLRAAELDQKDPVIWNNLAYVYLAAGCPVQARQAVERALQLKPEDTNLLDSRREIKVRSAGLRGSGCSLVE
jgi:tetratricopeptide (TPR) repeat protein